MRGLRRGEVCALRGEDFDFPGRELSVWRQIIVVDGRCHVGPPKSAAGVRRLASDESTTNLLRVHWTAMQRRFAGTGANPDGHMFTHPDGRQIRPDWLTHRFGRLVKPLDLPPTRLHDLRHAHASLAGAAGGAVEGPDLATAAVDEAIRYTAPGPFAIRRFPVQDVAIEDVRIPAGDTVLLCLAAAHRDPTHFPEPDRFDIQRTNSSPILGFGHGFHYCLGAPLARIEAAIAVNTLLARHPRLALAIPPTDLRWRPSFCSRGLLALPVHFEGEADA